MGRTTSSQKSCVSLYEFQLTRPVWGEPVNRNVPPTPYADFNSLAPCGANLNDDMRRICIRIFQLTRPVWGEPLPIATDTLYDHISTHSPRVGRTFAASAKITRFANFNSLAPCGANLRVRGDLHRRADFNSLAPCGANLIELPFCDTTIKFQLTRPVWGEPPDGSATRLTVAISTHSPRVGRTVTNRSI